MEEQKIDTILVYGLNKSYAYAVVAKVQATIHSMHTKFQITGTFFVVDEITSNIPHFSFDVSELRLPKGIILADNKFNVSSPVDMLLGVEIFWELLCIGHVKATDRNPTLQKTKLGWIAGGKLPIKINANNPKQSKCNFSTTNIYSECKNDKISKQLECFWQMEELQIPTALTIEEIECENEFTQNYTREKDGRFSVRLPTRENINKIGNTQEIAIKRFFNLENKLKRNADFKILYINFMREYETLGHMTQISQHELELDKTKGDPIVYLPHHGVLRQESVTTKLRVVFDGSAKSDTGVSLNDCLKVGPVIQDELFNIILRFRLHNIVFIADISKMYRQIDIHEMQRNLQRIVWREKPEEELKHYKLNTVTYGTAPASFLAIRALHEIANIFEHEYPQASSTIKSDFYVDDLISGANNIDDAKRLRQQIITILNSAKFNLRKWNSNSQELLYDQNSKSNYTPEHFICKNENSKTLGLLWNNQRDSLGYKVENVQTSNPVTKRTILSTISKIFDPLGLVGPITIRVKVLLQKLWQMKTDWDECVPKDVFLAWKEFESELVILNMISLPRQVITPNYHIIQLHGFCDASIQAYGACIYVRTVCPNGNTAVNLLTAKTRVAPLKVISLPRLELCSAVLLARLIHKATTALKIQFNDIFLWSDSTISLAWISSEPSAFHTFVANRISEIQQLTKRMHWNHVKSQDNPADIISRGTSPRDLKDCTFWWSGPEWLSLPENSWLIQFPKCEQVENLPEAKALKQFNFTITSDISFDLFNKFSSVNKLYRVVAYCLRFLKNCKTRREKRNNGKLTKHEIGEAENCLIKIIQALSFQSEKTALENNQDISKKSQILSLNPFLDSSGILRVGGRIQNSFYTFDKKHPILLPSKHVFCELLIRNEHQRLLHSGTQAVLFNLRNRYWIVNGKNTVKRVLRKCIKCYKVKPSNITQPMGNLPEDRSKPARPFSVVGVDFAGPFIIKDGKLKSRKQIKVYVSVFICFSTKAVHLELAGDLSTQSFLNTLKRFVARRGICKIIHSDNGLNFVGSDNELKKEFSSLLKLDLDPSIQNYLQENRITWNKIPPRAPSFGGLWEAAVKSMKFHMKRILSNALLTYEELLTVLTQIEAVMNSRPITPLSSDPNDFLALCPSHFLIGDVLTAIPEHDVSNTSANRLTSYHRLLQMTQHFWQRWKNDYITNLQNRTKWMFQKAQEILPGALVMVKEDNLPPLLWKMGRISAVHPGPDGIVRVVTVNTPNGTYKRSVAKICLIPTDY